jgi:hypothetical protein
MDDKLTTKQAITVLRNLQDWLYLSGINGGTSIQREAIDIAIKALEAEPHWIPVTERLPKEDGSYLVSGKWGSGKESVGDCEFSVEDGYFQTAWNFDVLAWMPMPEYYKGVTE